ATPPSLRVLSRVERTSPGRPSNTAAPRSRTRGSAGGPAYPLLSTGKAEQPCASQARLTTYSAGLRRGKNPPRAARSDRHRTEPSERALVIAEDSSFRDAL